MKETARAEIYGETSRCVQPNQEEEDKQSNAALGTDIATQKALTCAVVPGRDTVKTAETEQMALNISRLFLRKPKRRGADT